MKKILKVLLTIILCFCFIGTADASYAAIYSTKYIPEGKNTEEEAIFKLYANGNELTLTPLSEIKYGGETKGPKDKWSASDVKLILNKDDDKGIKIDFAESKYKNKEYLHYDIKNGKNKFYLSEYDKDEINDEIAKDIDLTFELKKVTNELKPVEPGNYELNVTCADLNTKLGYNIINSDGDEDKLKINIKDSGVDVNGSDVKADLSKISICGYVNNSMSGTYLNFSLIRDEKINILKQGLAVVKIENLNSNNELFVIPTYYYNSNYKLFDNGKSSAFIEKILYFDYDIINENPNEIFECKYNVNIMGDSADNMFTIKYNKTTGSFSADHVEGAGFLKGGEEFITQDIKDEMIKGSCPEKVYFCGSDPYTDHYFSTEKLDDCMIAGGESLDNNLLSSEEFKRLLGALKSPLMEVSTEALGYTLKLDGKDITLNKITANTDICNPNYCNNNPRELTITGLKNVKSYCREKIEKIDRNLYSAVDIENREEECVAFDAFYDRLVKEGIIYDLAEGCGFISDDLNDKLVLILDVIKIAGPILAILFGMWDFTKVLFTGDADKEMKTAGKRFITRIIAAALLFLIPALIKIPLNIALEDQIDVDNPFCDVVE